MIWLSPHTRYFTLTLISNLPLPLLAPNYRVGCWNTDSRCPTDRYGAVWSLYILLGWSRQATSISTPTRKMCSLWQWVETRETSLEKSVRVGRSYGPICFDESFTRDGHFCDDTIRDNMKLKLQSPGVTNEMITASECQLVSHAISTYELMDERARKIRLLQARVSCNK